MTNGTISTRIHNMFKRKPKQPKPQVIQNYSMSYLDRRSRSYHKIVMTSFTGVFGLAGAAYLFSSNASSGQNESTSSNTSLILIVSGLALAAVVLVFALIAISRSHRK